MYVVGKKNGMEAKSVFCNRKKWELHTANGSYRIIKKKGTLVS
jgi:hypothetical protein